MSAPPLSPGDSREPGAPAAHVSLDELADAAEGLIDPERMALIGTHLAGCAACRELAAALADVREILAAEPAPVMPPAVSARLDAVIKGEYRQRAAHPPPRAPRAPRPTLGNFGDQLPQRSKTRILVPALVAASAATLTGFGGYVLSASSGMNEPPSTSPAFVNTAQLGPEASELRHDQDLSAHRFSHAWNCVRSVTKGRITDIASVVIDGQPGLLVYTRRSGETQVTVVTGCDDKPRAGPSTTLPR